MNNLKKLNYKNQRRQKNKNKGSQPGKRNHTHYLVSQLGYQRMKMTNVKDCREIEPCQLREIKKENYNHHHQL